MKKAFYSTLLAAQAALTEEAESLSGDINTAYSENLTCHCGQTYGFIWFGHKQYIVCDNCANMMGEGEEC